MKLGSWVVIGCALAAGALAAYMVSPGWGLAGVAAAGLQVRNLRRKRQAELERIGLDLASDRIAAERDRIERVALEDGNRTEAARRGVWDTEWRGRPRPRSMARGGEQ